MKSSSLLAIALCTTLCLNAFAQEISEKSKADAAVTCDKHRGVGTQQQSLAMPASVTLIHCRDGVSTLQGPSAVLTKMHQHATGPTAEGQARPPATKK